MTKKILIIEDDIETQFLFSELLSAEGYEVETASSGVVALKMIHEGVSPDLIFMDLNFPGGTPEEFTTKLRSIPSSKNTPIVIVSGKTDIADYARRLEAASYIKKPFDLDPLLNLIHEVL
jgi:DNA-binding response OmpR family regulator